MAVTVKPLRKLIWQLQSGSSYEEDAPFLVPFVNATSMNQFDLIEDEANVGHAFTDTPTQGLRHVPISVETQLDTVAIEPLLEAALGTESSGVFTFDGTTNTKKLSVGGLDAVKYNKYANVYPKTVGFRSTAGQKWMVNADLIGVTAEDRAAIGGFPASPTANGSLMTFHRSDNADNFFIANQDDAIDSGDAFNISDFQLDITTGFDEQFYNDQATLTPTFAMVRPKVSGSFKIARHEVDTFLAWRDADTALQARMVIYNSATDSITIDIPNLKINCEITDEDVSGVQVEMLIGRNGLGTSYVNSNYSFTSPVRFTVVNS